MNPRLQPSTRVLWALLLVAVSACSRTNDGWIEFEWPTDTAATSFDSVPTDTAPSSGESAGLPLDSGSSAHDSALPPDTGVELTDSTSGSGESGRDPRDSGAQDSGGDDEPESAPGTPSQDSDSDSPIDSAVRDSTLAADSTADTSSPETGEAPPIDSAGADSSRPRGDTGSAESADTCADSGSSDTSSDTADPDADGDGYPASADCDDGFAGAHPGADERCDLVDDDCDGTVDIGAIDADTWATLLGGASGDRFGAALLDAGDLDGDGYDDLVVGSPGADPSGVDAGMVELIPGSALGGEAYSQDIAVATYAGLPDTAELGAALAAGDLDGDGVTDLVAGEPGSARAHLFTSGWATTSGSTDLAVATLTGSTGDGLGGTLLAADLDADGLDDLAVCAPDRRSSTGICWTIAGIDLIDGAASSLASGSVGGDDPGDRLGTAAAVGDTDGDGAQELLVGAPGSDAANADGGTVLVVAGALSGNWDRSNAAAVVDGVGELGANLVTADLDGDGDEDLLLAALGDYASVYLVSDPTGTLLLPEDQDGSWESDTSGDALGQAIAAGEDLDGDGAGDLVLSAPGHEETGTDQGRVYVLDTR